ncbi:MAG: (2Fe-2S)-binding protein [Thermoplasmata archaeon]|nr:(2Fe-2S)-binding protein [Thermoplasmata archaeon]
MTGKLSLVVNGAKGRSISVPDDERLLDTLRWRLGLKGTKEGCRTGDCGACTVLVDGETTLSCLMLSHEVDGAKVTTIEGIAEDPEGRRVQAAFEAEEALQCGYCTPGFIVALTGVRRELGSEATSAALIDGLQGNLCRCTGYLAILRAVDRVRDGPP